MLDLNNINLIVFMIILFLAIIRFLKKSLHFIFLLIPPIAFSLYTKSYFLTNLAFWFVFTDFLFNHFNKVINLFNTIFLPTKSFSFALLGKISNCVVRTLSLYLILKIYIYLFNSITSTNISIIITNGIFSFISISIINIISNFLLKLSFIKTKKGAAK